MFNSLEFKLLNSDCSQIWDGSCEEFFNTFWLYGACYDGSRLEAIFDNWR